MTSSRELRGLLAHSGAMCLLDEVVFWDNASIHCCTQSHRQLENPLRSRTGLPAHCGIEYAGQAMAIHGRLIGDVGVDDIGYLASLKDVHLMADRLDDVAAPLAVSAQRVSGNAAGLLYRFVVEAQNDTLLTGLATVFLKTEKR